MVIIDSESIQNDKWLDPMIQQYVVQFGELTDQLEGLRPDDAARAADLTRAEELAAHLCDGSRQIVYRMHRVTRKQLGEAAAVFHRAADVIQSWQLAAAGPAKRDLIHAYGTHIRNRAELLASQIS